MAKDQLTRYRCDECGVEVISQDPPRGWVRILSTSPPRGDSKVPRMHHHDSPPKVWTPSFSRPFPDDNWWCSSRCLAHWIEDQAGDVIASAREKATKKEMLF